MTERHIAAMPRETLAYLDIRPGETYVDMTVGASAGHSRLILEASAPDGRLIGLDRDASALQSAARELARFEGRFELFHAQHTKLPEVLREAGVERVAGALLDAGVSREQMLDLARSFSFTSEQGLDMRMDRSQELTAWTVVNTYSKSRLTQVLSLTGRGREARRIAARIVAVREGDGHIQSTAQLAALIADTVAKSQGSRSRRHTHPATPWLMAIRAHVNDEAAELQGGLRRAAAVLAPSRGRLVVLSWASHEHRLVRRTLRELSSPCDCPPVLPCVCGKQPLVRLLTPKSVFPQASEVEANPATRSCRLWAAVAV